MSESIIQQGAGDRTTMLGIALAGREGHRISRIVIDKALAGDTVAARFVIGHLTPRPRGRPIVLDLPDGARAGDIVAAFNATMLAMAAGEITPDEALTVTRVFDGRLKALKAWEMESYLTRWNKIPGDEMFYAYGEELAEKDEAYGDEEGDDEGVEDDGDAPAVTLTESSPACSRHSLATPAATAGTCSPRESGRGQGEGASPANHLHLAGSPRPDPLPQAGEGVGWAPAVPQPNAVTPQPDAAASAPPLHSACIQPSPATIAGRRRVAELARQQWLRELTS